MRHESQYAAALIDLLLCVLAGRWRRCLEAIDRFRETRMMCAGQRNANLTPTGVAGVIQATPQLSLRRLAPTLGVLLYTSDLKYDL